MVDSCTSFANASIRQPEGRLRWTCDVDTDRARLGKAHLRKLEELTNLLLPAHLLLHLHHVLLLLLLVLLLLLFVMIQLCLWRKLL